MIIYPAIDIRNGRCVRLLRGDYGKETVYGDDPVAMARRWIAEGATWLHVVDLDGAATGAPANLGAVEGIASLGIPVQFGGGLRTVDSIVRALAAGARRVVLGTVAIEQADLVGLAVDRFGPAIAVGVDSRNGLVATRGWFDTTEVPARALVKQMASAGVQTFICTDIARDGTLAGPNVGLLTDIVAEGAGTVIASGGIGTNEHVKEIARSGVSGVILGRALYEGTVRLVEALAIAEGQPC